MNIHVNNHNKVKDLTTDSYLEHSLKPAAAKTGHPTQPKDLLSSVNNSFHGLEVRGLIRESS